MTPPLYTALSGKNWDISDTQLECSFSLSSFMNPYPYTQTSGYVYPPTSVPSIQPYGCPAPQVPIPAPIPPQAGYNPTRSAMNPYPTPYVPYQPYSSVCPQPPTTVGEIASEVYVVLSEFEM